ncbi:protein lethal(2)denticleless-like [Homarus americanus]|uniref:protein lethal(2)denticleless-like n=1 Tax=Homarus americanus TaxID=6706 RepID=UPI001C459A37|nr:protein lethal(2)denticleless-like [Homarus americanus]
MVEEEGNEAMKTNTNYHLITELITKNIKGYYTGQVKQAQQSLYAWGFKCYRSDEYEGIAADVPGGFSQGAAEPPIYVCKFGAGANYGHILVLANEDGQIGLRDTRKIGPVSPVPGQQIHDNAIFDVCWVPGAAELVSVSGDQKTAVLSVREDGTLDATLALIGHTRSVKTVHVNPYDPCVIATGARDGNVIIWDKRCKPYHKADEIAPAHHSIANRSVASPSFRKGAVTAAANAAVNNSVTGVVFQKQHVVISSGASDGLIKLWDLRKTHGGGRRGPQCQSFLEHSGRSSHKGYTALSVSPARDVLYASCMDNVIYAYHLANPTPKPVAEYTGHKNLTYFVKSCISPCGSYILSGSSDNSAYIWLTDRPGNPIARLSGHFAEVSSVSWCPEDDGKLVTCADDMKVRIFRRKNCDMDDFDEKINIRGTSEPYGEERGDGETGGVAVSRERVLSECQESLPPRPVTPSTSGIRPPVTPSSTRGRGGPGASGNSQTPRNRKGGKTTPCTPKTNERNTLLQWLSLAKTPGSQDSPRTAVSETKKAGLKRKLTDLIREDQENVKTETEPKSPNYGKKNVLCSAADSTNRLSPPPSAAKMLKYGDDSDASPGRREKENDGEVTDSVEPIEARDKVVLGNGFRTPVTNVSSRLAEKNAVGGDAKNDAVVKLPDPLVSKQTVSPPEPFKFGRLSSPTANLPNFIVDGRSPHSRPETRVEKKRNTDWLTSLGHQRKLKFTRTPDKVVKEVATPLGSSPHKHTERKKVLQIKHKKDSTSDATKVPSLVNDSSRSDTNVN